MMPPEIKVNLHPLNFLIISGILQSIILACILLFYRSGNKMANRLIGIFVLICGLHFSWSLIIDTNLADIFKPLFWVPYSYLLAIGPLLFFYTKALTTIDFKIDTKASFHFLPVLIEVLIQMVFINSSIRSNTLVYDLPGFLIFRIVEFAGTAISILLYGKQCLSLVKAHEAWAMANFSNQKDITLSWLSKLIKYLLVLWIFWLAFELSFFLFLQFQLHLLLVYLLLYILLGVITYSNYWIAIQTLIKSDVLTEKKSAILPTDNANVYSRLTEAEIKRNADALSDLMQKEKLFLHETLSLRTLASKLQKDPNLVSYILNNFFQKSFYDYVNDFRIEEVKNKIDDPAYSHFKIVEIAYECGFNSKATFNRVFKKSTGKSPSEYKNRDA
ncbi:MAG TPA: AraC family transcriptional regulator [Chryseolinea sp.]|nr:AraC family transcriptional regulator [Chryseolinea sp.]